MKKKVIPFKGRKPDKYDAMTDQQALSVFMDKVGTLGDIDLAEEEEAKTAHDAEDFKARQIAVTLLRQGENLEDCR